MIADGRVKIDGAVVTTPATVLTTLHGLTVDDKQIKAPEAARLFVFHKPAGLLTAERDPQGRPTIYTALRNALPAGTPRLMPVGRLDLNTEGLLLLTNDGELKRALELPASGVPRTYRARTYGEVTQAQLESLMEGTTIDGVHYGRIDANMERRTGRNQWIELTLTEGKNREVRRVLEALGLEVSRLLRIRYGPFELDDLPRGQAFEVRPADVERFARTLMTLPKQPPRAEGAKDEAPAPKTEAPARKAGPFRSEPARTGAARSGPPKRKPDPSRPVDRDAPRSPRRDGKPPARIGSRRGGSPEGDSRSDARGGPGGGPRGGPRGGNGGDTRGGPRGGGSGGTGSGGRGGRGPGRPTK